MYAKTAGFDIEACSLSYPGFSRDKNQDRCVFSVQKACFLLADGIGGQPGGDIAAQKASEGMFSYYCKKIFPALKKKSSVSVEALIASGFEFVNRLVYNSANADSEVSLMGTTLCALFFMMQRLSLLMLAIAGFIVIEIIF